MSSPVKYGSIYLFSLALSSLDATLRCVLWFIFGPEIQSETCKQWLLANLFSNPCGDASKAVTVFENHMQLT